MNTFSLFLISSTNIFNNIKEFLLSLTIIDVTLLFSFLFLIIFVLLINSSYEMIASFSCSSSNVVKSIASLVLFSKALVIDSKSRSSPSSSSP